MGPSCFLLVFPTNSDPANILGDTEFDFDKCYIPQTTLACGGSYFRPKEVESPPGSERGGRWG